MNQKEANVEGTTIAVDLAKSGEQNHDPPCRRERAARRGIPRYVGLDAANPTKYMKSVLKFPICTRRINHRFHYHTPNEGFDGFDHGSATRWNSVALGRRVCRGGLALGCEAKQRGCLTMVAVSMGVWTKPHEQTDIVDVHPYSRASS